MANLVVRKVVYSGDQYSFDASFDYGLNIVEGENGHGKTTLVYLLYYALGGRVEAFSEEAHKHQEVYNDTNNYVEVTLEIAATLYTVRQFLKDNKIAVTELEQVVLYDIVRRGDNKVFSDWLLDKLQIEVFSVYLGSIDWKINFMDLMRLMYYDQSDFIGDIMKTPDNTANFVNDSAVIRQAIFEILIGFSSSQYYAAYNKLREIEKERNFRKDTLESYGRIVEAIRAKSGWEDINTSHLAQRKSLLSQRVRALEDAVQIEKKAVRPNDSRNSEIQEVKKELLVLEERQLQNDQKRHSLEKQLKELNVLNSDTKVEIENISKILYTHSVLDMFHSNTCPICLRQVSRESNKCICGNEISPEEYTVLFYEAEEYQDILKAKTKSLSTIEEAIGEVSDEVARCVRDGELFLSEAAKIRDRLGTIIQDYDARYDNSKIVEMTQTAMAAKQEIVQIDQQIEVENQLMSYQTAFDKIDEEFISQKNTVRMLEGQRNIDIARKRARLGEIYSGYMVKTLQDCRSATINQDYSPVINGGTYKEKSSVVPIRLMYFLALLKLSLLDESVAFPKFLIVDTPDTAGIDDDALINDIAQIQDLTIEPRPWQIILTTGIGKYPPEFRGNVKLTLGDERKLLQKKSPRSEDSA